MQEFAEFIIKRHLLILITIAALTLFFASQTDLKLEVTTIFSDLLPQNHPHIKIPKEFRRLFGGAHFLVIIVNAREGDTFSTRSVWADLKIGFHPKARMQFSILGKGFGAPNVPLT